MFQRKKIKVGYKRLIALLLCTALCMEGASLTVQAAEPGTASVSESAPGQSPEDAVKSGERDGSGKEPGVPYAEESGAPVEGKPALPSREGTDENPMADVHNPDGDTGAGEDLDTLAGGEPDTPAGEEPGAPAGGEPDTPAGEEPGTPSEEDADVHNPDGDTPAGEEPDAPAEEEPDTPAGEEPDTPAGEEPGTPSGGEPDTPAGEEPGMPSGEEPDTPAGEEPDTPAGEEPDMPADGEPGQISGNSLETVSENTVESVSENSLDGEWQALAREAEEAYDALLSEKPLMALLYHTDSYDVRREADEDSGSAATLEIGQTLYLQGVVIGADDVWYRVGYWQDGAEGMGYVQSYYLAYSDEDWIAWEEKYLCPILERDTEAYKDTAYGIAAYSMTTFAASFYGADTSDIAAFPGSYQEALRNLKNGHPNWIFVPMNTGLDFDASVSREMGDKSLIQKTNSNTSKGWVGEPCPSESGWYYATRPAVAYHMDPRNFMTETSVFQFEQLTFNASYHTESAVQGFLNGTFMRGTLPDDAAGRTYARAFYEIGSGRKLSPIHLASRVYQEQGQGTSGLISGTYPGYEGYYNFFNVGVNGSSTAEKIVKGLTYAKGKGWNTRYKSLEGGAATIGNNYILKGQDTIYLEKFNVDKNSPNGVYEHQYMQNIQAPASESSTTRKMYANAGSLDSAFVFKIPVFNNMPEEQALRGISLDKAELRLRRPDTVTADTAGLSAAEKEENTDTAVLQVRFEPADTTSDKTIVWSSSNQKVVQVSADPADASRAVVTAVGKGEAAVTARASGAGDITASCKAIVSAPIYRVALTNRNAQETDPADRAVLLAGQSINLSAEYWPKDTTSDTRIAWSSSEPEVAVVSGGKVTAVGNSPDKNTAVITAAIAGCEADFTVKVEYCTVTFMKADGKTALGAPERVSYGGALTEETIREKEEQLGDAPQDSIFIGWYTGENGSGSRFDGTTAVHGKNIVLYPYYAEQGKGFYVLPPGDQTYTGSAIKPAVQVFDSVAYENGEKTLVELALNRDYTVSYKNNKNVSSEGRPVPTVTVKGKGNYAGTQQVTFRIIPKALTDTDITADDITAAYSGKVIKSAPTVYRNGKKLRKNTDYTVAYPLTETGAYQTAGVYPVVLTGKGGYTGKITVFETITRDVLLGKASVSRIPKQTYSDERMKTEGGIRPASLNVAYKKQPLVEGKDYTVTYSNDRSIGKATATLEAVEGSGYAGSKSVTYQIVGTSIAKAKVTGLENKAYVQIDKGLHTEGEAYEKEYQKMIQTPGAYSLTLDGHVLEESKDGKNGDYVVSYGGAAKKGAAKAGTASIVFKGINAYSGQLKKTYKILPYALNAEQVGAGREITAAYHTQDEPENNITLSDLSGITTPYVRGGSKPVVLLWYRGVELTPGKDYSISYRNNKALTAADMEESRRPSFTIKGKGNFKGKLTGFFTITDGRFDQQSGGRNKVTMTAKDVVYREKKNAYKTRVTLRDVDGAALTAGRDYSKELRYTYEEDTEVLLLGEDTVQKAGRKAGAAVEEGDIPQTGTVIRVTAQGIGAYAGDGNGTPEIHAVYRIIAKDIAKAKVRAAAKNYQEGREVKLTAADLTVTVNGGEKPLVCGVDYVIEEDSYVNHTKKGRAKVTLRGIGDYGGEKTITYTIGAKRLLW